MKLDSGIETFLGLLKAGLWGYEAQLSSYDETVNKDVYRLSEEQTVSGLVFAGLDNSGIRLSKEMLIQWIGRVQSCKQRNYSMNLFLKELIGMMRKDGIYVVLVKGQGIGQCYPNPLLRQSGDIDLLISKSSFPVADHFLATKATFHEKGSEYKMHRSYTIDSWDVELHGTLRGGLWKSFDKTIDDVQNDVFFSGNVRSWQNNDIEVFLPSADNDVFIVFAHILQHFFQGGIGLRQICDWCRLLWTYHRSIDEEKLEQRLEDAGIVSEWHSFANMTVDFLGMPSDCIPLFSSAPRYKRKAKGILSYILESGNWGNNKNSTRKHQDSVFIRKIITFRRRSIDLLRLSFLFPFDALKVWLKLLFVGVYGAVRND